MKAYWQMFQMGAITPNEIRASENRNHRDDPDGDTFYVPVNIAPVSEEQEALPVLPPLQLATAQSAKTLDQDTAHKYEPLFERITRSVIEFERERVMKEAERRFQPDVA